MEDSPIDVVPLAIETASAEPPVAQPSTSRSTPTPAQIHAFLTRLISLVEAEALAESLALSSTLPVPVLLSRGLALAPLSATRTSVGLGGRTLVDLEKGAWVGGGALGDHRITAGDLVRIETAESAKGGKGKKEAKEGGEGLEGVVWKVHETKVVVALGKSSISGTADTVELPEKICLIKLSNPSTTDRQIAHLNQLLRFIFPTLAGSLELPSELPPLPSLLKVLLGISPPATRIASAKVPEKMHFFDGKLNESQRSSVQWIMREAGEVALLWGPPGTGKTQTLIELIRQFLAENPKHRILVCGSSNLAIDNLLSRLLLPLPPSPSPSSPGPEIIATRLGDPIRSLPLLHAHTLASQALSETSEVLTGVKEDLEALEKELLIGIKGKGRVRGKEREMKWREVRELRKEYRSREGRGVKNVLGRANVVVGTCHSAGGKNVQNEWFDMVVIDEATQCSEPSAWIPLSRLREGGRLVLAGDDMQLPPTVLADKGREEPKKGVKSQGSSKAKEVTPKDKFTNGKPVQPTPSPPTVDLSPLATSLPPVLPGPESAVSSSHLSPEVPKTDPKMPSSITLPSSPASHTLPQPSSLSQTLFTRLHILHGPSIRRMLTVQYRFNALINDFPSRELYGGELVADESVKERKLSDLELDGVEELEGEEVVFIDTADLAMYERSIEGGSYVNENEAALVLQHITSLVKAGLPSSCIAVISPYSAQVSLLARLLQPLYPHVEISSIDGFQGREQEVVIISLVRSNPDGDVGFLADKRRLNVAMTRAKRHLMVVGDSGTVKRGTTYLKDWMKWLEAKADVRVAELE